MLSFAEAAMAVASRKKTVSFMARVVCVVKFVDDGRSGGGQLLFFTDGFEPNSSFPFGLRGTVRRR